ncbi:TonB-dependent receptor [Acidiphilium iwatense]|uniref:TonB-dependent receptor n=1 Tax=Acidiphilium iwatense TaxID=768198 RepID=A0ABS9DR39_9PROT|nr:TonB-dependent receptor [Acidiphilium iwatense]MCF3945208.1 TonB-dependent receptor [Acidiphilium iwatense]
MKLSHPGRKRLLLLTACSVATGMVFSARVWAQNAPAPVIVPAMPATGAGPIIPGGGAATPEAQAVHIEKIKKFYHELLLKEKNIANAVSSVGHKQIEAEGEQAGSIQSLLKQTPSVNEYQQNIGQGVPVLTVRGVRNSQLAQTLDGIPMQDLISGSQGAFLNNNVGSPITLGQLSATTVYPGVAPPDKQGFATVGGTIAYETKKPTSKPYAEIFGGIGSFDTTHAGFEINTGRIGSGIDAPRALLRYNQQYTAGFPDGNSIRSGDMLFSIVKPYDEGLSHLSGTILFNRADGYISAFSIPVPLQQANSYSYNFPHSLSFSKENNKYLTAILSDETYINPHLIVSGKLFMIRSSSDFTSFMNPYAPGTYSPDPNFPYQVNFQVPYLGYGALGPTAVANGVATNPEAYAPGFFTYDPFMFAPAGCSPTNPTCYSYGESAEQINNHSTTIGFTPKVNIFLPHNDITIGGLVAKESSSGQSFMYATPNMPNEIGNNSFGFGGGIQRTIYSAYLQDKINLLHNRLHLLPGVTFTGIYTSNITQFSLQGLPGKLQNWGAVAEPYFGISYDLPYHMVAYASYGKSARFAPATDYSRGSAGSTTHAPTPEIVHLYEAGLRYDTARLYLNGDIYYQKINDQFSFYTNYQTLLSFYANTGSSQYRGYEFSGKYRLTHDIELFGNASYTKANYLNNFFAQDTPFEGQFGYVFKGNPLAAIPNWLGNFGVEFDRGPFSARLSGQYTGQQYITFDLPPVLPNTPVIVPGVPNGALALATAPYYPSGPANLAQALGGQPPVQNFKLPGYILMNLFLSYKLRLHGYDHIQYLKFSLNIHNLLGLHYYQHYFLSPAEIPNGAGGFVNTPTYASAFVGIPRSIFFNVTARF